MTRLHLAGGLSAALVLAATSSAGADPVAETPGPVGMTAPGAGDKPTLCHTTLADMQAADPGWQLLEGRSAALYTSRVIFLGAPEYDTIAYLQKGNTVLLLVSFDGCVTGHSAIPLRTHEKGMRSAVGMGA